MDKVITDGVDVSGCCCHENGKCLWTKRYYENNIVPDCEKVKDCYYKQLQRAKAENETIERTNNELRKRFSEDTTKLSAELKELQGKYNGLNANYNSLKFENERLKETEKEISDFISDISTCGFRYDDRCPDNLDELQQCIEDLCNKFDNYKQALQEIRDMAEKMYYTNDEDIERDLHIELQDKINEVIGAE